MEAAAQSAVAICDHHLARANYCPDTGARAVAGLYERREPAVLLTVWSRADFDPIPAFSSSYSRPVESRRRKSGRLSQRLGYLQK